MSLAVVPVPWKRFQPMERERWLDDARRMAKPGGIVSVDPHVVGGGRAIQIIYKRQFGSGYMYTGIIRVEVREYYYQITMVTGKRGRPESVKLCLHRRYYKMAGSKSGSIPSISGHSGKRPGP